MNHFRHVRSDAEPSPYVAQIFLKAETALFPLYICKKALVGNAHFYLHFLTKIIQLITYHAYHKIK